MKKGNALFHPSSFILHPLHSMKPCISQATTMPCSFADDVANFADAGCPGMEVWLTKLEQHLEANSTSDTQKLLADRGIELAAAAYQGGLLLSQGDARRAHFDHFRKRLDICQAFGIPTLLLIADFVDKIDETDLERAVVSLTQAAQWAAASGVTLGLEFRAKNTFCASLDTAIALVDACPEPNVGVALDLFHYYTGPSKLEDFDLLPPGRLAHVQFCDVAGVARELATDADRILPGDGDYRFAPILEALRRVGYDRWVSLELMNPMLWQANPKQVVEIGITALRKILGQATER
ncbi:MAG TPA: sugar phosphate isomerase/epimerase [Gemmataceae bacterium]|jgi:sugar phosphate isomerase/epimerase|nr:sugar phosphate isomerase/epimerase [Gemmataceae bacterium]